MRAPWLVLFAAACAGRSPGDTDVTAAPDRGPTEVALDGDPNGLWWDAASATLYIADDNGNRVLAWTDTGGLSLVGALPAAAANGPGLGQIVLASGRLYVTRFGFGTAGDVAWLAADGATNGVIDGLDPERRRLGLAVTADGRLLDSWFVSTDAGRAGAVSIVDPTAGTEVDFLAGLVKPVGVVEVGGTVYISDQDRGEVLAVPSAGGSPTTFATVDGPDLLTAGPDGSLFTGRRDGGAVQIDADGGARVFVTGAPETRGVAYDAANRRLFFARHDPDGLANALEIVPVP